MSPAEPTAANHRFMRMAIALSQRGKGNTGSNPNVGCVIVKDSIVIGRGWTQSGGRPHAEAMALEPAGDLARGADVYTTLEPCAHKSERGQACAGLLIAAKPKRVYIAALDPDKRTYQLSSDHMREAGIAVESGLLEAEARRAMAGFFTRQSKGRPHVTLKLALSLDGCIAMADGSSQWITREAARQHAHLERARSDAILVGSGTLKADNPSLDVRLEGMESRSPAPVVLGKTSAPDGWTQIDRPDDIASLENINWLMVEGGASTAASFLKDNLVDRLLFYRAPIIIGGGLPGIGDIGLFDLADAHDRWRFSDRRQLGQDVLEIYDRAA